MVMGPSLGGRRSQALVFRPGTNILGTRVCPWGVFVWVEGGTLWGSVHLPDSWKEDSELAEAATACHGALQ